MDMTTLPQPIGIAPLAPGPIGGPAAWRSGDLAEDDFIHSLGADDVAEIERAVEHSRRLGILAIDREAFSLPGLAPKLARLRRDITDGRGFGYLRGLPSDTYDRETLTRIYWGLSRHIGDPVPQNRNGHMIGHVIDIGTRENDFNKRITQTAAELQFHSDGCDVVGLLCIRTARTGGESMIVSAVAVHDAILARAPDLWRLLYDPIPADRRGEIPAHGRPWFAIPLFNWHQGTFSGYAPLKQYVLSARRFEDVPPLEGARREAFEMFLEICNDPGFHLKVPFRPGDIQYLQNHLVFHSRTAYEDWPAPAPKRHLMRIWLSLPDGRDLPHAFLDRWPQVERGTLRGGIRVPGQPAPSIPLEPETPAYE